MDLSIFFDPKRMPRRVSDALTRNPIDYSEQDAFIEKSREGPAPWAGGGVLLPLFYQPALSGGAGNQGEYVFLLNKRSRTLPQGGDLCAPGGGASRYMDRVIQKILNLGVLPGFRASGLEKAKARGDEAYEKILFYLGNALRESWEEIHLSPFNVEFLGPLPSYRLHSRRWIIFPLVGEVREKWVYQLSPEVEKIVPIPLAHFYDPGKYILYSLEIPQEMVEQGIPNPWVFPGVVQEADGEQEILWGATFQIIQRFLKIVLPFPLPSPDGQRVIHRPLPPAYLSGEGE
jgi:8-oxo-dGTP pyrophosphatase MutT (NUDIX family)